MADTYTIVTTGEGVSATRNTMITYLNTGTAAAPLWSPMGLKVIESNIEYDWGLENNIDILGNPFSSAKIAQMTQNFGGSEIVAGDNVMNHLVNLAVVEKSAVKLVRQDCLIVHTYLKNGDGQPFAERYPSSAVLPTTIGGEGGAPLVVDIDVTYGGTRATGTAAVADDGVITFTPENAASAASENVEV